MEKDFETEVLTRLTKIETKLDDYKSVKSKSDEAFIISKDNQKRLDKIEDNNKWLFRTSIAAIITSAIGILVIIFKNGAGGH